ncbi:ABC transporter permease [Demequina sp. TTPB684]|uniref:ABC transporter permease n=1 Tax=unclassified Demequina TaxID=2620311 RepID=UPI001CF2E3FD|nr:MULTISPECIES: ABC transporter permease [unclassified Demequina]MCB2414029.1 ABC transporter permease [Demequina sp. TTPB684]UPU89701.1 ABC transporter permease [Demequina sp. TMPB413]
MRQISLRALRAHWPSAVGVFLTMLLAASLVSGSGTLLESGLRESDPFSTTAVLLPALMSSFGGVAVMIAVFVVSSSFAAALRDRRREFALLRAVGATSRQVRALVTTEVMMISLPAVLLGGIGGFFGARALVPLLRSSGIVNEGFAPVISPWPLLGAAALLLPAAWIAGRLAAREMARMSPTAAVNTTAADSRVLGQGRIIAAWICAAAGVAATASPLFVPGTMGGATGAASSLLLITAVALAGPALVLRGSTWLARRKALQGRAAPVLATVNARGYSRRLTAAVVPLALVMSLGIIQTGTNRIIADAGAHQLREALQGELVWQGERQAASETATSIGDVPGVTAATLTDVALVQAKFEASDEDAPLLEGLAWEATSLRLIESVTGEKLIDAGVAKGDLAALAEPDTIAVSSDALVGTGKGVGDPIELRFPDGSATAPTIVAVYDNGLALGPLIVGSAGFPAQADDTGSATVIVDVSDGGRDAVVKEASDRGITLTPTGDYVDSYVDSAGGGDRLSDTLLMVLLAFVCIAAANALVIATRSRKGELVLLGRLGATGRQLRAMLGIESTLVALGAITIGTATALPGLAAASLALLPRLSVGVDPALFGGLAAAVTLIAFAGMAGARLREKV